MDKKYQVFISSTYDDLKEERQLVLNALMKINCIPAGMELFSAFDEEQLKYIKSIIDESDYYLLIIGGRYGSVTSDGISYTEKEYDYALSKGLKIIALIHSEPESIPLKNSENDTQLRQKLEDFRTKAKGGRIVDFWKDPKDLPGLVMSSLMQTMQRYPATGWVRADKVANEELLSEINHLRKENEQYRMDISRHSDQIPLESSVLDEIVEVSGYFKSSYCAGHSVFKEDINVNKTWRELFLLLSRYLVSSPVEKVIQGVLGKLFTDFDFGVPGTYYIKDSSFRDILIKFKLLGLIKTTDTYNYKGITRLGWTLTERGYKQLDELV